jgi:transcriptional regulator with XRE-family HTH domain
MIPEPSMSPRKRTSKTRQENGEPNPVDTHVGERIRLRRGILGMTQTELSRAMGVTLQQIQKYERGINRVSSSRLFDLAGALQVSVGYFFDELAGEPPLPILPMVEDEDLSLRYETKLLVRAYYGITDPAVRAQVCELARALSAPSI